MGRFKQSIIVLAAFAIAAVSAFRADGAGKVGDREEKASVLIKKEGPPQPVCQPTETPEDPPEQG